MIDDFIEKYKKAYDLMIKLYYLMDLNKNLKYQNKHSMFAKVFLIQFLISFSHMINKV